MYNYNTLSGQFLQYKRYLGYKYKTDEIVIKEIVKYLNDFNIDIITKEVIENYVRLNKNMAQNTIARNIVTFKEFCHIKYQIRFIQEKQSTKPTYILMMKSREYIIT